MATWTWFHRLGSPPHVYGFARRWTPWFGGAAAVCMVVALYGGLVLAPEDYQQGITVRIMYIHVPFAWLAMFCYTLMALSALGTLVWRHPLADVALKPRWLSARPRWTGLGHTGWVRRALDRRNPDLMGRRRLWLAISAAAVTLAIAGIAVRGLNFGVEFTGGGVEARDHLRGGHRVCPHGEVIERLLTLRRDCVRDGHGVVLLLRR